jgi:hypothetical protein
MIGSMRWLMFAECSMRALVLLELAFVKLEPGDALKLTHGSRLQTPA